MKSIDRDLEKINKSSRTFGLLPSNGWALIGPARRVREGPGRGAGRVHQLHPDAPPRDRTAGGGLFGGHGDDGVPRRGRGHERAGAPVLIYRWSV